MILAVDEVMKLPEFAVQQNEKVIEEKLNAAELMIRAYTNNNFDTYNSLTPNWYYKVLR